MRTRTETNSEARLAYELHLGKRVSDNHWYQVKRNLEDGGFQVNADTAVDVLQKSRLGYYEN
jgi:hypothetical protein